MPDRLALSPAASTITEPVGRLTPVTARAGTVTLPELMVVVNVSDNQWAFHDYGVLMGGETGTWTEVFNSQAPEYGGLDSTGNFAEFLTVCPPERHALVVRAQLRLSASCLPVRR